MPRPPIERAVSGVPRITLFKPAGVPGRELEQLRLAVDELEAIRLVDLEGLSHEQAAEAMGVSRQTVGRVLERGRAKVAEALVGGKAILIGGGQYRVEPRQLFVALRAARSGLAIRGWASRLRARRAVPPTCDLLGGRAAAANSADRPWPRHARRRRRPRLSRTRPGARPQRLVSPRGHHHSAMIEQPGTES